MRRTLTLSILAMLLLFGILSCSARIRIPFISESTSFSINSFSYSGQANANKNLWGYWDISIDPDTWRVEIVPMRGVEFRANVTMFLQPPAGSISNLGINVTNIYNWPTEGFLDVEVTLTHPFPGLDMYTGFDVLGVFINDGDTTGSYDPGVSYARTADTPRLLNFDGLTRWFNPSEFTDAGVLGFTEGALGNMDMGFTGTVNPYKYFCDQLTAQDAIVDYFHEPANVDDRGLFGTTASNTRLYQFEFPVVGGTPNLVFQYAVVASWEPPTVEPPMNIPDDFPSSANASEAFHLSIVDNGSNLFYDSGVGGGTVNIRAELFDWGASINPSGILGEFSQIIIESPNAYIPGGYMTFAPEEFAPFIEPGTVVSSVAELELEGVEPTSSDDVEFLVTVETQAGETYDQGFPMAAPDVQLASYFIFTIPVGDNPCGNFSVTGASPSPGQSGEYYAGFIVDGSNFQSGPNLAVDIVDGIDIVASATLVVLEDINTISCNFDFCGVNPGSFDLRVTNGCDPPSYASISYTIDPDPLKNIELRSGTGIHDLGICETTGEPYVQFVDGQLWIYNSDYSSGVYKNTNTSLNRIDVQKEVSGIEAEATMGRTTNIGQFIYDRDQNYYFYAGYSGNMIDVMTTHNTRHYYCQNAGSYMRMSRRSVNGHGGNITGYYSVGSGTGQVNMGSVVGIDASRNLAANDNAWFYFLEGSPDYSIERINYLTSAYAGQHGFSAAGTFLSGPGDGQSEINDPRDITTDIDSYVYILDEYSSGEPVVKVYDSDLVYVGEFGDSVSISGDPLRIDADEGDGEIHVLHSDGVSIFRLCELPI